MSMYSIAKITTIIEIVLTCNCLLFFEFYGLAEKKSIWVLIGMIYRCILILGYVCLGIFMLVFVAPVIGGIGTAIQDGVEAEAEAEAESEWIPEAEFDDIKNGVNDIFSSLRYI